MAGDDTPVLEPLSPSRQEFLDEALIGYEQALSRDVHAVRYLASRGFTKTDVQGFRLGLVADPAPGHHRFEGMLVIPYLDRNDRPLTLRFRCLQEHDHREVHHGGKYNSIKGDAGRMFNIREIHRADDEIHVTEGELDCMILNKIGLHSVAIPGAQAYKPRHRRMLAGFSRVHVWGDPDDAGAEFTTKITGGLRQAHPVLLRGGDVNEVFLKRGAEALLKLVR